MLKLFQTRIPLVVLWVVLLVAEVLLALQLLLAFQLLLALQWSRGSVVGGVPVGWDTRT